MELRRLSAQLLDVLARRVRFEQGVIDHPGYAGGCPAEGVDADARRAGIDDAAQAVGTAVAQHAMTGAADLLPASRGRQLRHDHVDQPLKFVSSHESPATSPEP